MALTLAVCEAGPKHHRWHNCEVEHVSQLTPRALQIRNSRVIEGLHIAGVSMEPRQALLQTKAGADLVHRCKDGDGRVRAVQQSCSVRSEPLWHMWSELSTAGDGRTSDATVLQQATKDTQLWLHGDEGERAGSSLGCWCQQSLLQCPGRAARHWSCESMWA